MKKLGCFLLAVVLLCLIVGGVYGFDLLDREKLVDGDQTAQLAVVSDSDATSLQAATNNLKVHYVGFGVDYEASLRCTVTAGTTYSPKTDWLPFARSTFHSSSSSLHSGKTIADQLYLDAQLTELLDMESFTVTDSAMVVYAKVISIEVTASIYINVDGSLLTANPINEVQVPNREVCDLTQFRAAADSYVAGTSLGGKVRFVKITVGAISFTEFTPMDSNFGVTFHYEELPFVYLHYEGNHTSGGYLKAYFVNGIVDLTHYPGDDILLPENNSFIGWSETEDGAVLPPTLLLEDSAGKHFYAVVKPDVQLTCRLFLLPNTDLEMSLGSLNYTVPWGTTVSKELFLSDSDSYFARLSNGGHTRYDHMSSVFNEHDDFVATLSGTINVYYSEDPYITLAYRGNHTSGEGLKVYFKKGVVDLREYQNDLIDGETFVGWGTRRNDLTSKLTTTTLSEIEWAGKTVYGFISKSIELSFMVRGAYDPDVIWETRTVRTFDPIGALPNDLARIILRTSPQTVGLYRLTGWSFFDTKHTDWDKETKDFSLVDSETVLTLEDDTATTATLYAVCDYEKHGFYGKTVFTYPDFMEKPTGKAVELWKDSDVKTVFEKIKEDLEEQQKKSIFTQLKNPPSFDELFTAEFWRANNVWVYISVALALLVSVPVSWLLGFVIRAWKKTVRAARRKRY